MLAQELAHCRVAVLSIQIRQRKQQFEQWDLVGSACVLHFWSVSTSAPGTLTLGHKPTDEGLCTRHSPDSVTRSMLWDRAYHVMPATPCALRIV